MVLVWKCDSERERERESERRRFYVFGASEFEILREWEYTCTVGIYFMGISGARRFDILI